MYLVVGVGLNLGIVVSGGKCFSGCGGCLMLPSREACESFWGGLHSELGFVGSGWGFVG